MSAPAPPPAPHRPSPRIVLASGSRSRRALMTGAGLTFDAESPGVDERALEGPLLAGGAMPAEIAVALADAKARAVSARRPDDLVIGADQTLGLGARLFVKAENRAEAAAKLAALAGRTHELHAALALARGGAIVWRHLATARLTMRPLSETAIAAYLDRAGDAVLGSVGCYHYEGLGIRLFEAVEGDYFTILGLPMLPLLAELEARGLIEP